MAGSFELLVWESAFLELELVSLWSVHGFKIGLVPGQIDGFAGLSLVFFIFFL